MSGQNPPGRSSAKPLAPQTQISNEDSMYPESDDLSEYLVSDTIVDWQTPAIRQKALELTRPLSDEVTKAPGILTPGI